MFKRIVIELAGPICGCANEDLSWNVIAGADLKPSLVLACNGCRTSLTIASDRFVAAFTLEKPYAKPKLTKASADVRESKLRQAEEFLAEVAALLPPRKS